jgi:shikimate dehydrogenase
MHNNAFRALSLDAVYIPLSVNPEHLPQAVAALRAFNFLGANVTIPFKNQIIKYLDFLSPASSQIQAVNVIINQNGKLHGDTTDPGGMLRPLLERFNLTAASRVCILGNGGSARTAAFALALLDSPPSLMIAGRVLDRVQLLEDEIRQKTGALVNGFLLNSADFMAALRGIDVLINCTPAGMHPDTTATPIDASLLSPKTLVYDIIYNPPHTRLLREARARGCRILNGRDMLIEQARASFKLWFGIQPPPEPFVEPFERRFGKT